AALPGLQLLDRDLELGADLRAAWLARAADGAHVLVLQSAGEGDQAVLDALDALAFARARRTALAHHGAALAAAAPEPGEAHAAAAGAPAAGRGPAQAEAQRDAPQVRVVLVAERFARRVLDRLEPLVAAPAAHGHGAALS